MGNIFSYCSKVQNKFKDNSLLQPLNENDYKYSSFVNDDSYKEINNSVVLETSNIMNKKIEILEGTTQSSLKNISSDIKHIYVEQEELKKYINRPRSSICSNDKSICSNDKSICSNDKSICSNDKSICSNDKSICSNIKYEIDDSFNQPNMFVSETLYHDFYNTNNSSEEETY